MIFKIDAHDIALRIETREFYDSKKTSNHHAQSSAEGRASESQRQDDFILPRRQIERSHAAGGKTDDAAADRQQYFGRFRPAQAGEAYW